MHCGNNILMILRNSRVTYDMVQLPGIPCDEEEHRGILPSRSVLASYEKGIHYVALDMFQLQMWKLTEFVDGQLGWTLTHETNLSPFSHQIKLSSQVIKPMAQWELVESSEAKVSLFEPLSGQSKEEDDEEEQAKSGPGYLWDSDEITSSTWTKVPLTDSSRWTTGGTAGSSECIRTRTCFSST